jgi:hypothetical protein
VRPSGRRAPRACVNWRPATSPARASFRLGADEGLWQSAKALAGTYDPEQLGKFHVVGLQPDIFPAKEWHGRARVLGERPLCEEGALTRMLSLAADKPDAEAELTSFWAANTSGDGLAYVVIKGAKDEPIYRYGDEIAISIEERCGSLHAVCQQGTPCVRPAGSGDRTALRKATVVKFGEPGFRELEARYVSECNNPDIRSAVPTDIGEQPAHASRRSGGRVAAPIAHALVERHGASEGGSDPSFADRALVKLPTVTPPEGSLLVSRNR